MKNDLGEYLASDEELLLTFAAEDVTQGGEDDGSEVFSAPDANSSTEYSFGATDRRIVYLDGSGGFKDIDYHHISSIESELEEDNSEVNLGVGTGCCGGFIVLGGIGGASDQAGMALLMIIIGVALIGVAAMILRAADASEKQKIKFITGDEDDQQIEVTLPQDSDANIGAELSSILREQR